MSGPSFTMCAALLVILRTATLAFAARCPCANITITRNSACTTISSIW